MSMPLFVSSGLIALTAAVSLGQYAPPSWIDWQSSEQGRLSSHVQLTFGDRFAKAGEAYFDEAMSWVIFQAVEADAEAAPRGAEFYEMFVAKLIKTEGGTIVGLEDPIKLSAPGSSNTCGWFHPTEPWRVIFGSTITPPAPREEEPGFQRGTSRYVWQFPADMQITATQVQAIWDDVHESYFDPERPAPGLPVQTLVRENPTYEAECSYSPDGRHILFASMVDEATKDLDLYVHDLERGVTTKIVEAPGYDGGPFFSADGKRICYRSDRNGDDLLQLFVADLAFDDDGAITGISAEHRVTANEHVNWCPFWHPSGEFMVYATSESGHANYEVYAIEVPEIGATAPYELKKRRVTEAAGFDGLPVFNADGSYMMWTSQRTRSESEGVRGTSQIWVAKVGDLRP